MRKTREVGILRSAGSSIESYIETSSALVNTISEISAPVILVHAQNDPVVDYSEFEAFAQAQQNNSRIFTLGTPDGSHCDNVGKQHPSLEEWASN